MMCMFLAMSVVSLLFFSIMVYIVFDIWPQKVKPAERDKELHVTFANPSYCIMSLHMIGKNSMNLPD